MVRKIVKYGNPVLEEVSEPVAEEEFGSEDLRSLVTDMFETMYQARGVGLAAPPGGRAQAPDRDRLLGRRRRSPAPHLDQSRNRLPRRARR